ncbi:MAG: PqqD family peptide modification chaperone [Minwuia sp.]|nr:PqqD family peptide modification chaperone [Minwuia sp.]
MSSTTYCRLPDFVSTDMDGETVLMSIEHGSYFGVGGVAALIWDKLEQPRTEDELVSLVRAEFEVSEQDCRKDVQAFLADLVKNRLVAD